MAELHVQPKRNTTWWIWLLLAAIAIALIFFLSKGCNAETTATTNTTDSLTADNTVIAAPYPNGGWADIDFNSPAINYNEVTDKDISVKGTDQYAIYGLGENILFDVDNSTIRKDGETKLKEIATSLKQRYKDGDIRIYGHTDSTGDAAHNQQLAAQRAEAVKSWLVQSGTVVDDRISIHPLGESQPVASNATESGRQQNRSVQIVARKR